MKILIAEDDSGLQRALKRFMEFYGFYFDLADNGLEAMNLAIKREGEYDLCLMDIKMPLVDGFIATEILRQKIRYFPILAFSGSPMYREECFARGMDDFLEKPCDPEDLFNKINELTVKSLSIYKEENQIKLGKVTPMNQEELRELRALKKKGLTKLKLAGTDYTFVVHKNIQNKISHDLIGEGKELSEFIDRSEKEPGRCHLYKANLHVTKDIFIPQELDDAVKNEDEIASKFPNATDKKLPD